MDVDERLELVVGLAAVAVALGGGRARAAAAATAGRRAVGGALGDAGDAVAVARGLAGEEQPSRPGAARGGTRAKAPVEVGQVVQHRVAEDEVEGASSNGSSSASQATVATSSPSARGVGLQRRRACPGEMSVHVGVADHAGLQQVQLK